MPMLFMPFDELYLFLVLPALIFAMWAQHKVKGSFTKFSAQRTLNGMTGAGAAREILRANGLHDVKIERVAGKLTDHFDPRTNVIRLSESVHDSPSVAAVGVAAHEAGHAIQYANGYSPMRMRAAIIPVTNFGSKLAMPLILIGMLMDLGGLINIGILLFGSVALFQFITLPVEFNASNRALGALNDAGILNATELPASRKVLQAAALTYVAALAVSLAHLIRLIAMTRRR
jgi:hypothetical protein